jgi:hypothetical protein
MQEKTGDKASDLSMPSPPRTSTRPASPATACTLASPPAPSRPSSRRSRSGPRRATPATPCSRVRAATSLAQLWRDQGQRAEAHDILAPVCGWFTEGFDTLDLKEAKAMLEELA